MPRPSYDLSSQTPVAVEVATPPIGSAIDAEVDVEVLKAVPKQFCIEDEKSANWLVRKIVGARHYANQVKEWADREQRRAEREEQTLMYLFGRQIETWARSEIAKLDGRKKSVSLPAGTLGIRSIAAKLVIDDEQTVISWAKLSLPTCVVTIESLSKSLLNEHVKITGELPNDGCHIEPESERFYIK